MPSAEVEIGRQGSIAVMGELARGLAVPFIPAGHVVDHDHAGKRPRAKRTREIGIDEIALKPRDGDGFHEHAFVHVGLIHGLPSSSAPAAQIDRFCRFYWMAMVYNSSKYIIKSG